MKNYETEHYIFTYQEKSEAEKDIINIASEQEKSFQSICLELKVKMERKIHYFFFDSPEEVGKLFGDNKPCNGFADVNDDIYAVYNKDIKCIGPHEDTHIISARIGWPKSDFLIEGLAMYFDKQWWGIDNDLWTKFYKEEIDISISNLLKNKKFDEVDCSLSYPIGGSFTKFLIHSYGIDLYLQLYKSQDDDYRKIFEYIYEKSIDEIENEYWNSIKNIKLSENDKTILMNKLKENDISFNQELKRQSVVMLRDMKETDIDDYVKWFTSMTEWADKWDAPWEEKLNSKANDERKTWEEYFRLVKDLKEADRRNKFEIEADGNHIGWVSSYYDLEYVDNPHHVIAIGIDIPESNVRNKGYGTKALLLFIDYLFSQGEKSFFIQTWSGNYPMIKVIEKLGFKEYDRKKDYRLVNGKKYDAITYCLDK